MSLKRSVEEIYDQDSLSPADGRSGSTEDLRLLLRQYFPTHQDFKPGQDLVVHALLSGDNAAAIFPTGGGKSLCYQLPGLALFDQGEGMTVVLSPLLALMKDQVDVLKKYNNPVDLLGSSLKLDEKIGVFNRVRNNETAILYMAPEQLNNEGSLALIRSAKIAMIAIDEAHCISEWGHSFRPDYLRVASLCQELNVPRLVALTATATPTVVSDIRRSFHIDEKNVIQTSFYRPNLKCKFRLVTNDSRADELLTVVHSQEGGDVIVYCTLQKTTLEVAEILNDSHECEARPYHAGLSDQIRKETQEWFMQKVSTKKYRIVVATIAFGKFYFCFLMSSITSFFFLILMYV